MMQLSNGLSYRNNLFNQQIMIFQSAAAATIYLIYTMNATFEKNYGSTMKICCHRSYKETIMFLMFQQIIDYLNC